MTKEELHLLDVWSGFPPEVRLRTFISEQMVGEDYAERVQVLAKLLSYQRPEVVGAWLDMKTQIPVYHLPKIAEYLGVSLSILIPMWLSEVAPEGLAETLFDAARPRATDTELEIVEYARAALAEEASEDELRNLLSEE